MKKSDKTGLIFFPAFDWAISPTHPEREERLLYTRDQIFEEGLMDLPRIREFKPRLAAPKDIARTHFCVPGIKAQVTEAHMVAAGAALVLADALMTGEIRNGFALVRPPGHHAMKVVHGNRGFCNINNEAIMVDYLRNKYGLRKIAIVDTDVHHGDGTQDIFYHDRDILFISFHQDGRTLYPGSGFTNEAGGPAAYGRTLNIPLPPGTTDEGLLYVLDELIIPVLEEFQPDLIVNSAGQDNHFTDPLANMRITAQGYARLNEKLKPDIAVLEGGYAIETALPYVNTGIILAMAGLDYSHVLEPDYTPGLFQLSADKKLLIKQVVKELKDIWKNRDHNNLEVIRTKQDFWQRQKSIYYDTEGIHEQQTERLRLCPDCGGYLSTASQAVHPNGILHHILGISTPFHGCRRCREEAYAEYEKAVQGKSHDYVYLQDRTADIYKVFSREKAAEWIDE
ncbi:MAG: histone deacetylase [Thermincola sp.]|jgi:acetoin utilization deacetylase AcuC-like enzyme|nr:histone deacetylase [Thermincola sp.]MDT3704660.1 histone deacetylase [Thermincola sp.]